MKSQLVTLRYGGNTAFTEPIEDPEKAAEALRQGRPVGCITHPLPNNLPVLLVSDSDLDRVMSAVVYHRGVIVENKLGGYFRK